VERLAVAVALVVAAVAVAAVLRRRSAPPAPTRTGHTVPDQLDRADFARPDAPWLVVAFSSRTCLSCQDTWQKVELLRSDAVAVQDVPYQDRKDLHDRYGIEAVPVVLVADAGGSVVRSFVGPPTAAELWAAVAEARD
jgi:protein-disulfide isomerase